MIRQNWYLAVLCLVFLGLGVHEFRTNPEGPAAPKPDSFKVKQYVKPGGLVKEEPRERVTPQDKARAVISEHEQRLAEGDLSADDEAAYMNAIGNLYLQKLRDYEKAAAQYEMLLNTHPQWGRAGGVYLKLAMCYERNGDEPRAQAVYLRMLDAFPEGSDEHQAAAVELGLQD